MTFQRESFFETSFTSRTSETGGNFIKEAFTSFQNYRNRVIDEFRTFVDLSRMISRLSVIRQRLLDASDLTVATVPVVGFGDMLGFHLFPFCLRMTLFFSNCGSASEIFLYLS